MQDFFIGNANMRKEQPSTIPTKLDPELYIFLLYWHTLYCHKQVFKLITYLELLSFSPSFQQSLWGNYACVLLHALLYVFQDINH